MQERQIVGANNSIFGGANNHTIDEELMHSSVEHHTTHVRLGAVGVNIFKE